jgi:hypothetical protein
MAVSMISIYRGGAIDEVTPLARSLKAIYLKYGIAYRLSRFESGPNAGDWLVIVTCPDAAAFEKAGAMVAQDAEVQHIFVEISKFAERISREMIVDLDL